MGNSNIIQVTLTVKDDGTVTIQQFGKNTEEALAKTGTGAKGAAGALTTLKENWIGLTAAATAAYLTLQKAMQFNEMAARGQQAEETFRAVAVASGENVDKLIAGLKRATAGTIEESDLMQSAIKGMMLDFSGEQMTKMAEAARVSARVIGQDVGTTLSMITDAISTNMPKALKGMGLITKTEMELVNKAIAAGIPDVDLYGIAMANAAIESAKLGGVTQDNWERMQEFRAEIKRLEELLGGEMIKGLKFLISTSMTAGAGLLYLAAGIAKVKEAGDRLSALTTFGDLSKSYGKDAQAAAEWADKTLATADKLAGAAGAMGYEIVKARIIYSAAELEEAKKIKQSILEETQARLDATETQKKAIENLTEILKIAGASESQILEVNIAKREADLSKYYEAAKQKIIQQTAIMTKGGKDQEFIEQSTIEKTMELRAEILKKYKDIEEQKTLLSFKTAQDDIKNLTSRLGDYQKYYDSLKAQMDKNTEDEKKHLDAIKALHQQSVDGAKSAAALIAGIKGPDKNISAQQQYESQRSALNSQYGSALDLGGQDRIKALEDYKQAVAALQQQFSQGVQGANNIFGKPQDIISAAKVAEDAISDINRAEQSRQSVISQVMAMEQQQAQADQTWAQVLQGEAIKAQGELEKIITLIFDISTQLKTMQTTITLTGDDQVSSVVANITARIEQLHRLAAQPLNIGGGGSMGGGSTGGSGNTPLYGTGWDAFAPATSEPAVLDKLASGTPYVPRTGIYKLHQGEAVVPAEQNRSGKVGNVVINGGINLQIPAAVAPQRPEDWRMITRNYIVPEIRKLSS